MPDLRRHSLDYHEHALKSSVDKLRRYQTVTRHLQEFASQRPHNPQAHEVRPDTSSWLDDGASHLLSHNTPKDEGG